MDVPQVVIDGEIIKLERVKAKSWRLVAAEKAEESTYKSVPQMLKFISNIFDTDEVTEEKLEENLELSEVLPLYLQCYAYVFELVTANLPKKKEQANA